MFWYVENLAALGIAGTSGWLLGLAAGSILLTWLYASSGRSIAVVSPWHTALNFTTATRAAAGIPAAAASTVVLFLAIGIVLRSGTR